MLSLWPKDRRDKGDSKKAAEAALASASEDLQNIRSRAPEVTQLVKALQDFQEKNHLGEALEALILHSRRTPS
jgi:hypothetical protein